MRGVLRHERGESVGCSEGCGRGFGPVRVHALVQWVLPVFFNVLVDDAIRYLHASCSDGRSVRADISQIILEAPAHVISGDGTYRRGSHGLDILAVQDFGHLDVGGEEHRPVSHEGLAVGHVDDELVVDFLVHVLCIQVLDVFRQRLVLVHVSESRPVALRFLDSLGTFLRPQCQMILKIRNINILAGVADLQLITDKILTFCIVGRIHAACFG